MPSTLSSCSARRIADSGGGVGKGKELRSLMPILLIRKHTESSGIRTYTSTSAPAMSLLRKHTVVDRLRKYVFLTTMHAAHHLRRSEEREVIHKHRRGVQAVAVTGARATGAACTTIKAVKISSG